MAISPLPFLVDTHAHLYMLEHAPTAQIVDQAKAAGVGKMISVSTEIENWPKNKAFAEAFPNVYYTIGLHPHDATKWPECRAELPKYFPNNVAQPKCVGIGEMGLDYFYNHCPRENQIAAFEEQVAFAKRVDLPLIIHCREAFPDLFHCLKRIGMGKRGGVLHCFTGTTEEALEGLDHGLKISFSGILTFKKSEALRETAKRLPLSEVMVETDCPFLTPEPFRGKPNEPAHTRYTAQRLAEIHNLTLEEITQRTTENAVNFFRL